MSNIVDLIREYNEWLEKPADRTPEAFDRYLKERAVINTAFRWIDTENILDNLTELEQSLEELRDLDD